MRGRLARWVVVVGAMALVAFTSTAVRRELATLTVTPDGQASGTLYTNTSGHTAQFTLDYSGNELDPEETFNLFCSGSVGVSCSVQSSISMYPNVPENVDVTFSTSSSAGTDTVRLHVYNGSYDDWGSRTYTIQQAVSVSGLSVPSSVVRYSEAQTATYTVLNGSSAATYTMTCEWDAASCSPSPASASLGANQDTVVTVTFDAGAVPATYPLKLTATSGGNSAFASDHVTVSEYVSVSAVADPPEAYVVADEPDTLDFEVRFPGQSSASFQMTVSCPETTGRVHGCAVTPAADTLKSVGDTPVTVRVAYTSGSDGDTSAVTLTATQVGESSVSQEATARVITTDGLLLDLDEANAGLELNRGDCVTIAAGPGAIVCDDYQFVYPFTPVTRKNSPLQLALFYNSSVAHHKGRSGLNIAFPKGTGKPDSIKVEHVVNGSSVSTVRYESWNYQQGENIRVADSWTFGVPAYEQLVDHMFIVRAYDSDALQSTDSIGGKQISLELKRWFGRGWWLAGYEHVRARTDADLGNILIWTGGDASARVYVEEGADTFVARSRAQPDTIFDVGSEYVRHRLGGGEVRYNSSGYHTHTINANNDTTLFNHALDGQWTVPKSIEVSTPAGLDTIYKLDYDSTNNKLETVQVRSATGGWDTFSLYSTNDGAEFQYDSITAPDGRTIHFGYDGGPGEYTLDTIVDYAGAETVIDWSWEAVRGVTTTTATDTVALDYIAASAIGVSEFGTNVYRSRQVEDVESVVDGPLPGTADTTSFYVTGWGAVRGIRDALGNETWIDREDPSFPALPTRVRYPNGWEVTASYNSVGLADTIIDGSNGAVTATQWNTTLRVPTQTTSPEGIVTSFTYDANGNLLTRTVGSDKDSLHYNSDHQVDAAVDPMGNVSEFDYDSRGNLLWEQDPLDRRVWHAPDYLGRDTLVVTPIDTTGDSIRVRMVRNAAGQDSVVTTWNDLDSLRTIAYSTYDAAGRLTKVEPFGLDYVSSQWDTITTGSSEWHYDELGRVTAEIRPGTTDSLVYDEGGRMVERHLIAPDTAVVTMTYDLLGRLETRVVPDTSYDTTTITVGPKQYTFPHYASSGVLTIPKDSAAFTYDVMGNMLSANNDFAHISRTYALNGALRTDTMALRTYSGSSYTTHVYGLQHLYDRDGRRIILSHPAWMGGGTDQTVYAYNATTGRLASITDPNGNAYTFSYNANGLPTTIAYPGGSNTLGYDALSRIDSIVGGKLDEHLTYDFAGRISSADGTNSGGDFTYNGLGHVIESTVNGSKGDLVQQFGRDAFGNAVFQLNLPPNKIPAEHPGTADSLVYTSGGRVVSSENVWVFEEHPATPYGWNNSAIGSSTYYDDHRGNNTGVDTEQPSWSYTTSYDTAFLAVDNRMHSRSWFSADGQLRVFQVSRDSADYTDPDTVTWGKPYGSYEEYWYDALGRRVLRRIQQESPICTYNSPDDRCQNATERYVWDGDQILWELRASSVTDDDPTGSGYTGQFGKIVYVHAGGIDAPLGMVRNDSTVVLHRGWRGGYIGATRTTGIGIAGDVPWPGVSWEVKHSLVDPREVHTWVGSVSMSHMDQSGLIYQRNRYYNPAAGQFTQGDPIGIAGGLNLYGYANGDPVNHSDPFGLRAGSTLKVDTVEVQSHSVLFFAEHASIRITPNDQARWASDPRFSQRDEYGRVYATIGAGPGGFLRNWLTSEVNRPNDLGPHESGVAVDFGDIDENAFIERLFRLDANYCDCMAYSLPPGLGYNSNSYVHGLVLAAGGSVVKPDVFLPMWNRPLPGRAFGP